LGGGSKGKEEEGYKSVLDRQSVFPVKPILEERIMPEGKVARGAKGEMDGKRKVNSVAWLMCSRKRTRS